jgi:RNA polymerase sigma factor (sigma-70 family)
MLTDPDDVEDAFQATFLVLARRAGSIQDADRLGPWLHGVARRVASRSRALSARRNSREKAVIHEPSGEPSDMLEASELRATLDEELSQLPEKYRAPLVLCYLEGLTHDEAAEKLRWPVGTVRSRLAGGRDRLRDRLTRRGLAPTAAVPAILARASIPQALLSTTVRIATTSGTIPAQVATLAKGVLAAMIASKLKIAGALGLMTALTVGGVGLAGQQKGEGGKGQEPVAAKPAEPTAAVDPGYVQRLRREIIELDANLKIFQLQVDDLEIRWKELAANSHENPAPDPKKRPKEVEIDEIRDERALLNAKILSTQRKIEELRFKLAQLTPSKADPAKVQADDPSFYQRFGELSKKKEELKYQLKLLEIANWQLSADYVPPMDPAKGQAALDSEREAIRKLEIEVASKTAQIKAFEAKVNEDRKQAKDTANPEKAVDAKPAQPDAEPKDRPKAPPMVMELGNGWVVSIPSEQDRVTVLNTETGFRSTHRFSSKLTELLPVWNGTLAFSLEGPEVRQILAFSFGDKEWYPHDLKEPVTKASPIVSSQGATYELGRFSYIFSLPAREWSTFEDKRGKLTDVANPPVPGSKENGPVPGAGEKPAAKPSAPQATAKPQDPPKAAASVIEMGLDKVIVIPSEKDRVTILNTETGARATQRFARSMTNINPMSGAYYLALDLEGPEIRQVAVYNFGDAKWYAQDLKEPVTKAYPIIGNAETAYQLGRFLYVFSTWSKSWSVLELKHAPNFKDSANPGASLFQNGRIIVPDGDVIHVYNVKTGEWIHSDTNAPDVEVPATPAGGGGAGPAPGVGADVKPATNSVVDAKPQALQPIVHTFPGAVRGNPTLFAVVSAERDRVTMIDSKTHERQSFRLPEAATEIVPIVSGPIIGLNIKGPKITRVGFYDRRNAKWFEHDLKKPTTEVSTIFGPPVFNGEMTGGQPFGGAPGGRGGSGSVPGGGLIALSLKGAEFTRLDVFDPGTNEWTTQDLREPSKGDLSPVVTRNTVSYRSGRFLYIYGSIAKKWAVLELKREDFAIQGVGQPGGGMQGFEAGGSMIIPDGDVIHIYNAKTGEWTQIDTKDEK